SEELARQDAIAAHAKQQARGTQSAGQSAAEGSDDQNSAHGIEQQKAANPATDVHVGGLKIRKRVPVGPHACPEIGFKSAAHTGKNTGQHNRQQDVALWILDVFGERSDAVETNVGERREGSRSQDAMRIKSLGVIKRLSR